MFAFVGAFLAQLVHDVVAFIRLPAALALLLRSPHATPQQQPPSATMPRAKGSKAIDLAGDIQRRQMVHIRTKEECRLANETVDVWSIELPSKHAEAILKCVTTICHLPSAICVLLLHFAITLCHCAFYCALPSAFCNLCFALCVLPFAFRHSYHRHSLTPSQSNQRQHTRPGCHRLAAPSSLRPPALHARPRRRPA